MQEARFEEALEQILAADPRYPREAYDFVREALDYTQKQCNKEEHDSGRRAGHPQQEKHVTGQQLLEGIRHCALTQFGPMAITVFDAWGIHHCRDFGNIVFNMVESQLLRKTESDSRKDFEDGYDFNDAWCKPFLPSRKLNKLRSRPQTKAKPA